MKITTLAYILLLFLAQLQPAVSAGAEEPKNAVERPPLAVLTGRDSRVTKTAFHRLTTEADWKRIWLAHLGLTADTIYRPALEVDFNRCFVVAVFQGTAVNSNGYRVVATIEKNDAIIVRIESIGFQTAGPDGGAVHVTPYAFIVLPKTEKTIVLEDNVQGIIGKPPLWKEIAQLKGT